ncbi:MAG: carboxypeptidase regulatory-like domain-containing protein, partial [Desulfuromonadales bacterium]|nr:carboxypeptidase regulatory-like domain-containing protein [Desulfuromonadales bacterium]NIS39739.1 carboxypeptidase regulatory-like domain-containing protein [Desulfuromonadales bacterium]
MVRKAKSAAASETFSSAGQILVNGRIVDAEGAPVAGLHVFAYVDRVIGHKRPAAMSAPTGKDGRFRLGLEKPGVYYVGARQNYGDSPIPGELFGMYDESADHGLKVESGRKIDDIEIIVEPISLSFASEEK